MSTRTTHTTARLEVSRAFFEDVKARLRDAGYDHAFLQDGSIDMTGIAIAPVEDEPELPKGLRS